ncbi:M3 family oligoendopeptidase [bacterium]|nr:M3 family oligoendopeptidase [bacterium]
MKIQTNQSWNLNHLYTSDEDPQIEKDINQITKKVLAFEKKWRNNNRYMVDPRILLEALTESDEISKGIDILAKPLYYFYLRLALEQDNAKLKARMNLINEKETELANKLQFFGLNIGKISKINQPKFLRSSQLKEYKHFLEKKFELAKYQLSEKEENIVNLMGKTSSGNWATMISEFVSKEVGVVKKQIRTFEQLMSDTHSLDTSTRNQAGQAINQILNKWVDVSEHEINSILEVGRNLRKVRGIKEPDQARLLSDDLDKDVVYSMIRTVTKNFQIPARFYNLLAKLVNQDTLGYHERAIDYEARNKKFPFSDALALVNQVYTKLDPSLGKIVEEFNSQGLIDVLPRKGKRGGAFCIHEGIDLPIYILLNHNDKLQDTMTLAHELGHGINSKLIAQKQLPINSDTPLSTAEVASTFFEDFVSEELLAQCSEEERFALLLKKIQDDVSTIFRQVACYNFELELHEQAKTKGYLSKKEIGEMFVKHMSAYLGPTVKFQPGHENWWVYWSHIRNSFYVYSYASGLLISKALQSKIKANPSFINDVKLFLSAGSSKSPKVIFADLGIDITDPSFWSDGLSEISKKLTQLEALAKKLGKI